MMMMIMMMMMIIIIIIIIIIIRAFTFGDMTVEQEMHATGIVTNKEKFGIHTRKTFDRFTTKDSYTWNITHNTESTAV